MNSIQLYDFNLPVLLLLIIRMLVKTLVVAYHMKHAISKIPTRKLSWNIVSSHQNISIQ